MRIFTNCSYRTFSVMCIVVYSRDKTVRVLSSKSPRVRVHIHICVRIHLYILILTRPPFTPIHIDMDAGELPYNTSIYCLVDKCMLTFHLLSDWETPIVPVLHKCDSIHFSFLEIVKAFLNVDLLVYTWHILVY